MRIAYVLIFLYGIGSLRSFIKRAQCSWFNAMRVQRFSQPLPPSELVLSEKVELILFSCILHQLPSRKTLFFSADVHASAACEIDAIFCETFMIC